MLFLLVSRDFFSLVSSVSVFLYVIGWLADPLYAEKGKLGQYRLQLLQSSLRRSFIPLFMLHRDRVPALAKEESFLFFSFSLLCRKRLEKIRLFRFKMSFYASWLLDGVAVLSQPCVWMSPPLCVIFTENNFWVEKTDMILYFSFSIPLSYFHCSSLLNQTPLIHGLNPQTFFFSSIKNVLEIFSLPFFRYNFNFAALLLSRNALRLIWKFWVPLLQCIQPLPHLAGFLFFCSSLLPCWLSHKSTRGEEQA